MGRHSALSPKKAEPAIEYLLALVIITRSSPDVQDICTTLLHRKLAYDMLSLRGKPFPREFIEQP